MVAVIGDRYEFCTNSGSILIFSIDPVVFGAVPLVIGDSPGLLCLALATLAMSEAGYIFLTAIV